MKTIWENIVDCLRNEAAEYGQLLHLIEEQQKFVFKRDAVAVLEISRSIQAQADTLQDCRRRRERIAAEFAAQNGRPANHSIRSLLPLFEPEGRPLVEALIGEVNRLVHRVRRAMHLNRRLLGCTLEFHQELLRRLRPDAFTKTYARNGRISVAATRAVPTLQSAG